MKTIRTIRQAAAEYKAADPDTPVSENLLRRLITDGALPYSKTGSKFLLDMEIVDRVLSGQYVPATKAVPLMTPEYHQNKVRRIEG